MGAEHINEHQYKNSRCKQAGFKQNCEFTSVVPRQEAKKSKITVNNKKYMSKKDQIHYVTYPVRSGHSSGLP